MRDIVLCMAGFEYLTYYTIIGTLHTDYLSIRSGPHAQIHSDYLSINQGNRPADIVVT